LNGYDWETIGEVKGSGNQTIKKTYHFVDNTRLINGYYSLKQVDYDGKFEYSKHVSIDKTIQEVVIPFYDNLTNSIVLPNLDYTALLLTDMKGNSFAVNTIISGGVLQIDVKNLPAGIYALSASHQSNNASWKIWITGSGY
jgi:hypothetical protein